MPINQIKSYQMGALHARAYRSFQEPLITELDQFNYTMMEWVLAGLVYDYTSEGGARVGQIARLLDVEISLITNMLNALEQRGLIKRIVDKNDKRARRIVTTRKCDSDIRKIEKRLQKIIQDQFGHGSARELQAYITTLQNLAK